jgi:hypothetical protein
MKVWFSHTSSLLLLIALSFSFAADMTLVHEGKEFILHDNNTWDFVNKNRDDLTKNTFVTLDDNRIILLTTQYEWRFVDKAELKKTNDNISVKFISAKGTAQHRVVSEATANAKNKALVNATKKLKASIKHKKLNYNKLLDCVKRVEKEEESSESFSKGKGWNVTIKINLDKGSILAVLDCEGKKEEKKEEKKDPPKEEAKQ